jgi:hypothetical protein
VFGTAVAVSTACRGAAERRGGLRERVLIDGDLDRSDVALEVAGVGLCELGGNDGDIVLGGRR